MKHILPSLAVLFLAALSSCQNSSESVKLADSVPAPDPLPFWTQLADKSISSRSANQVKILTKLVEVTTPADDPEAPKLSKKTSRNVFSKVQTQVYLRKLAQKKGADIMTSPSVVTAEGHVAKVEIGREHYFPTESDPETFKKEVTGTVQYVRARPGNRKGTFKLDAVAEVSEFLGFHPKGEDHLEPIIQTRRLTGSSTLKSGESLVLSGLVTERPQDIEDRGLLFSKKRTEKFRTELIAIITVQSIGRSGKTN
ncbi:MAG: hypothetical protein ACON5H_01200 [Akkermansiaceae bacterium]